MPLRLHQGRRRSGPGEDHGLPLHGLPPQLAVFLHDKHPRTSGPLGKPREMMEPDSTGQRTLTNDEILGKYRSLTRSVIALDRQAAIEKTVLNIESVMDISSLIALLTPTVRSALPLISKFPAQRSREFFCWSR